VPGLADPAATAARELHSAWYEVPGVVAVPPDMVYYAVDQKALEPRRRGPHYFELVRDNQTVLQAHRWVDAMPIPGSKYPLLVGEWTVAERMPVFRGEYVGRKERVEVPVWRFTREQFVIAADITTSKRRPGIAVDFGYGRSDRSPPEAILVDFTGGPRPQSYERAVRPGSARTRPVTDTAATEVLLLTPDGKLLARSGADDVIDGERITRLRRVRRDIEDVKKAKRPTRSNPFGP
jgi:hypothetical protein